MKNTQSKKKYNLQCMTRSGGVGAGCGKGRTEKEWIFFLKQPESFHLDHGQLKKLDKVVANREKADGYYQPTTRHLEGKIL